MDFISITREQRVLLLVDLKIHLTKVKCEMKSKNCKKVKEEKEKE